MTSSASVSIATVAGKSFIVNLLQKIDFPIGHYIMLPLLMLIYGKSKVSAYIILKVVGPHAGKIEQTRMVQNRLYKILSSLAKMVNQV